MATAQVDYDVPFEDITDTTVSKQAPYSVLIFAVALSCTFLFRLYFLEMFLLPKAHPAYKTFTENERRSFVTHYLSACIKVLLLIFAIYPTIMLTWVRHAEPYTPFGGSKVVTIGDMLLVCSQVFCSMIVHELFFKKKVSPITAAHHLGALVTAQTAVILTVAGEVSVLLKLPGGFLNFHGFPFGSTLRIFDADSSQEDGVYQFILAFIWGKPKASCVSVQGRDDTEVSSQVPST